MLMNKNRIYAVNLLNNHGLLPIIYQIEGSCEMLKHAVVACNRLPCDKLVKLILVK